MCQALGDILSDATTEDTKRSSKSEMKIVSSEPSNLQRQVDITPEVLEPYKPELVYLCHKLLEPYKPELAQFCNQ